MIDERMFDFKGYYTEIAHKLQPECNIVECGVANGASSLFLAQKLKAIGKSFTLHMVDSLDYGGRDQLMEIMKNVYESGLQNSIVVHPIDSLNASCLFNGESINFCMLDSSHTYPQTRAEIKLWWDKIINGGILAGHDIFSPENPGVRQAVEEIIPATFTREPLEETIFPETKVLTYYQTEKGLGIWEAKKEWFVKLK